MSTSNKISGWININKPLGFTSAQIVGKTKRILKQHLKELKIGHAGTLDPEASGVLPIALNEATKLMQIFIEAPKMYRFKIKFGVQTDTGDKCGKIIGTTQIIPSHSDCISISKNFIGQITQTPSKFSAIKIGGKRAYDLARNNIEFDMPERKIHIFDLKCIDYDPKNNTATYITKCSKGTYIRSLAQDIALLLHSLGFVIELERIQVGAFCLKDTVDFDQLVVMNELEAFEHLTKSISKIDIVLDDIPVLDVDDSIARKVRYGQSVDLASSDQSSLWLRHDSKLLAIGHLNQGHFKSSRVFNL
jgi:tRNA pseudouridine55 synthase